MYFEAFGASLSMGQAVSEDWRETEPCNFGVAERRWD